MKDLIGLDNGYFKVTEFLGSRRLRGQMVRFWKAQCRCGNFKELFSYQLKRKVPKNCGCIVFIGKRNKSSKVVPTPNPLKSRHTLYKTWRNIKSRCYNKNVRSYASYGAKGIKVCDEWLNDAGAFVNWSISSGWKKGLVIDRINHKENYSPANCRFITALENNKRVHLDYPNLYRGSNNFNAKLNEEQVLEIKRSFLNNVSIVELMKKFNVSRSIVSNIKRGKTWKHVKVDIVS